MPDKNYKYYDFTLSLCPQCLKRVDAKIILKEQQVFMLKRCPEHGTSRVLISNDADYYIRCRNYIKTSQAPLQYNTKTHYGCPYDCGLCEDHEQHSCVTIVEVTDSCNLSCPTCYAKSGPHIQQHRSLETITQMLDLIVKNEGEPDVVQISGGEPTIHPQFFEILDAAKQRPIRHLMVNTNGIKIANSRAFTEKLASYMPCFEVYLQFDSFKPEVLQSMRGRDLTSVRQKALEHLNEFNISTNLVVTLQNNLNMDEIGQIIDFAIKQPCVRGITFQPTQIAGRLENFNPETDRVNLTDVRQAIIDQSPLFTADDLIPVPCNPDALVMGYALKLDGEIHPLTRYINPAFLLDNGKNTIVYENDLEIRDHLYKLFTTGNTSDSSSHELQSLLCCLPQIMAPKLDYNNVFRIIVMQFIDAYNFDVRAIKRSCVHIVSPDMKIIPFETMNLFYRDENRQRLEKLRETIHTSREKSSC